MATLTADRYLDAGVAVTAGETWALNGAVLTIRTDTRVHANAPASMTGAIGTVTVSATLGGGVMIDSRDVRWMPYVTGAGTVPAIGTMITQGAVSGYLLGVWESYTSAPTAVGAAMPVAGFLKFRSVTGGAFEEGTLTGIGAKADTPDRQGWIEVVQQQVSVNTAGRLGSFRSRGGWFVLDQVTSGAAGDVIQIPTNGGGVGTHVPAVWIETGVGTNTYEAFPAIRDTWFLAANLGTDARAKFVQTLGNGQVRIGYDGTSNAGYVPPAGCRIRIPSNIGRQCTTAARAVNAVPHPTLGTRPDFTTTAAGVLDFEFWMTDWYLLFTSPFSVRLIDSATFDIVSTSNNAAPIELRNVVTGAYNGTSISLTLTANSLGGTIDECKFFRGAAASNGHSAVISLCTDYVFSNNHFGVITNARSSGRSFVLSQCLDCVLNSTKQYNAGAQIATSSGIRVIGLDHCDRLVGNTTTVTGTYAIAVLTSSNNVMVDGLTFGLNGTVAGFHNPYPSPFQVQNSSNVTFRNAGTRTAPLAVASAVLGPQYAAQDLGANSNVRFQRIYMQHTRSGVSLGVNTSKGVIIENLGGTSGTELTRSINALVRGIRSTANSTTAQASVYGSHVFDMFEQGNFGRVWFAMNEPTAATADLVTLTLVGTGGFTSGGQVSMPTVGDTLVIEMPYFALGHTGFHNVAPVLTGTLTGNLSREYQIDVGAGWSAYQTLNAANLSSETIDPAVGFKLRLRMTTVTAHITNAPSYVRITTTTTEAAQAANLYPLDFATITLSGFVSGTRIQIYNVTDAEEVYNAVPSGTSLVLASPFTSDKTYRVRAMYQSGLTAYDFLEFEEAYTVAGFARALPQTLDGVYGANAIDGGTVPGIAIDDGALLVDVDLGTLSLQSLYAYETYWLQTEEGIRDEQRFITAVDQANYIFSDFRIRNVSDPTEPLVITGGYMVDAVTGLAITLIDTSGGTIFLAPEHVVPFASGSGVTAQDKIDIAALVHPSLVTINAGVQKASILVPHTDTL